MQSEAIVKLSALAGNDQIQALITLCSYSPAIWLKLKKLSRMYSLLFSDERLRSLLPYIAEKFQIIPHLPKLCELGDVESVWLLLMLGHRPNDRYLTSPDGKDPTLAHHSNRRLLEGATLLQCAVHSNKISILALLWQFGANINAKGTFGYTPLHEACYLGHTNAVQFLLYVRANVDALSKSGSTALLIAAREGHTAAVQALLDGGADVNDGGDKGWTPLSVAAGEGHDAVCLALLEAGADVVGWQDGIPPGHAGEIAPTALELAERCGHTNVCLLLRSFGALDRQIQQEQLLQEARLNAIAAMSAQAGVMTLEEQAQQASLEELNVMAASIVPDGIATMDMSYGKPEEQIPQASGKGLDAMNSTGAGVGAMNTGIGSGGA